MQGLIEELQRQNVLLFLGREVIESADAIPTCQNLARLPFRKVVVLGDAPHLVAAWRQVGRIVDVVSPTDIQPAADESRVTWLTLSPFRVSEPPWLPHLLRAWFAAYTVCFLGCNLEDSRVKDICHQTTYDVGRYRRSYYAVLQDTLAEGDLRYWENQGVGITVANPRDWVQQLVKAWAEASQVAIQPEEVVAPSSGQPYKFLDYYADTKADVARFFGRAIAVRDLGEWVVSERLTVCFGPSGVGKTSVLQAGLMPRLRGQGFLPIYIRPGADPIWAIRQATLCQDVPSVGDQARLDALLSSLAQRRQRTVVLLLDQLEETFTLPGAETPNRLAEELANCLRLPDASVHIVLSLREDFLAHLHTLRPCLPDIFAHRYRLRPLTQEEAREAIEEPARLFGLRYEAALTEQLLKDLNCDNGFVEPTDLQIACDALYRDLVSTGDKTFRLARYYALGGVERLLSDHLESVVESEASPHQVRAVLKAMVTAHGARTMLPSREIARLAGLEEETTIEILRQLDRSHRLVRLSEQQGEARYELVHEVLCPRILAWIKDPAELEAKVTQDVLRAELHNWRSFRHLPGPEKVRAMHARWDNPYLRPGPDELALMARSALQHGVEPTVWLERAMNKGVPVEGILFLMPSSLQREVHQRAAQVLGAEHTMVLLSERIRDTDAEVRARAATALGTSGHPKAFGILSRARHDPVDAARDVVWENLELLAPRAAERLRHRDEATPLLVVGALVYWLLLVLTPSQRLTANSWLFWGIAGIVWLTTLILSERLFSRLPVLSLSRGFRGCVTVCTVASLCTWLLIVNLGWFEGVTVTLLLLLLGGRLANHPYLILAAMLPYLPLLGLITFTADDCLWVTNGMLLILALSALVIPHWGRYGIDRPAAVALLSAGLGAVIGGLVADVGSAKLGIAILLATSIAIGRWWARYPPAYSGKARLFDALLWDSLDHFSLKIKPFLGGLAGTLWTVVLVMAADELSGATTLARDVTEVLWLGIPLAIGPVLAEVNLLSGLLSALFMIVLPALRMFLSLLGEFISFVSYSLNDYRRTISGVEGLMEQILFSAPFRRFLLYALSGAIGGWMAQDTGGVVVGITVGFGLGIGDWLAAGMTSASERSAAER